ncbi:MAG: hypothetical protein H7301_07260 [Cryobacterium sp.]|nr:hypothetical protein [Oligoflexia bacterium]
MKNIFTSTESSRFPVLAGFLPVVLFGMMGIANASPPQQPRIDRGCLNTAGSNTTPDNGENTNLWLLKIRSVELTLDHLVIVGTDNIYCSSAIAATTTQWSRQKTSKPLIVRIPLNPSNPTEKMMVTECLNNARIALTTGVGLSIFGDFNLSAAPANESWNNTCQAFPPANPTSAVLSGCGLRNDLLTEKSKWDTVSLPWTP